MSNMYDWVDETVYILRVVEKKEQKIVCPKCGKNEGFDIEATHYTLMAVSHWIDKNGIERSENPNISTTEYRCWACGHSFEIEGDKDDCH